MITVSTVEDRATLDRLVSDGELNAGFVIEPDFSAQVETGGQAGITVVGNRNAPISVSVAEAIAQGFASEVGYVSDAVATLVAAGGVQDPAEVSQIAAMAAEIAPPLSIGTVAEEGRGFDPTSYYAVSLSVFFVFFTVQFGVLSLIEEKEIGTLGRLIASPTPAAAMIVGKFVSSFVLGVVSMSTMVLATTVVMGAEWGSLPLVALIIVLGVGSAMALALVVSAFAKTAEQATAGASMLAVVLGPVRRGVLPGRDGACGAEHRQFRNPASLVAGVHAGGVLRRWDRRHRYGDRRLAGVHRGRRRRGPVGRRVEGFWPHEGDRDRSEQPATAAP